MTEVWIIGIGSVLLILRQNSQANDGEGGRGGQFRTLDSELARHPCRAWRGRTRLVPKDKDKDKG